MQLFEFCHRRLLKSKQQHKSSLSLQQLSSLLSYKQVNQDKSQYRKIPQASKHLQFPNNVYKKKQEHICTTLLSVSCLQLSLNKLNNILHLKRLFKVFCNSDFPPVEGADGGKFLLVLCLTGSQILPSLQFNEKKKCTHTITLQLFSVGNQT